jgi:hypothetical protein
METYLVDKWRKEHLEELEDNIFANNPFLEDLLEWRHSPEGEQFAELSDALCDLMEDVQLDAKQRKFIWPDGERLDLDQSVQHIQKQYPDFRSRTDIQGNGCKQRWPPHVRRNADLHARSHYIGSPTVVSKGVLIGASSPPL